MSQMNTRSKATAGRTYEGGRAMSENPLAALRRVLFAHMLWEDSFYEDGNTSADNLTAAVTSAATYNSVATGDLIYAARTQYNIRHASLMAAVTFQRVCPGKVANDCLVRVIQRVDELAEVLVMAARGSNKRGQPIRIPVGVRKTVKRVMESDRFDQYQYGKYKGTGKGLTLKDAVFLTHASPAKNPLVQKIVDGTIETPDTWEVGLSTGGDKKDVFTNLLMDNKIGAMALLRNLRGMSEVNVDPALIKMALQRANWSRVLPFRFMSAAMNAPGFAPELDAAFKQAVGGSDPLPGKTAVLLDTSLSMDQTISHWSAVKAYQAGAVLAAAINGDHVDLYQWATSTKQMPNWRSLSTAMGIYSGQVGTGTQMGQAIEYANNHGDYDRLILITDMQTNDHRVPGLKPHQKGYTINVSRYSNPALLHGRWTHLTGWSDQVLRYIALSETAE